MPVFGAVTLYSSLLKFSLHVHPDRLDYADQVLVCLDALDFFSGVVGTCGKTPILFPLSSSGSVF